MKTESRKKWAIWAGALALAALFFLIHGFEKLSHGDPDRYYHFALSRQMVDSGRLFLRELPQVEGLGWDKFFAEKEFLFHQVTALAYRFGGDKGVILASLILALAGILIFYFYGSRRLGAAGSFLVTAIFFGSPMLLWRLLMVRPHVLAIACFTAMVAAAVRRNRAVFFFSIFFFTLSYHAFYMPIVVITSSFLAYYFTNAELARKGGLSFYLIGLAGLIAGILVNPYFPANVIAGAQIALIPSLMSGKLSMIGFGQELYPVPSNIFLAGFSLPLVVFLAAIWRLSHDHRRNGSFSYATLFLVQLSFVYLLITFQSRRGAEYLLPTAAFLAVEVWCTLDGELKKKVRVLVLGAACLLFAWNSWAVIQEILREKTDDQKYVTGALKAVESLPADRSAKVFNCEWDFSPYLYYARPKMRFIDIMDPSLLYFANEEAHMAREELKKSEVADTYGLLKNAFKADYVFCRDTVIASELERDPRFRRLFPEKFTEKDASLGFFVYELRPEPLDSYLKNFEVSFLPAREEDFRSKGPRDVDPRNMKEVHLSFSDFLDLGHEFPKEVQAKKEGQALCALVKPADMGALAGATYLSLGGGRNIRIWKNGQPWFQSDYAYLQAAMHQQMIPMGEPLKKSDRLEFVVCSATRANFWGLSLLGLTEKQFADLCRWKRSLEKVEKPPFEFPYGRRDNTCMGDLAVKRVPPALR